MDGPLPQMIWHLDDLWHVFFFLMANTTHLGESGCGKNGGMSKTDNFH